MATFLSPMAATGLSTPTSVEYKTPAVWRSSSATYQELSSTACSWGWLVRRYWRARRDYALLIGHKPKSRRDRNEERFQIVAGCEPSTRIGRGGIAGQRAATGGAPAETWQSGGDRCCQGNPGHEERRRNVRQRGSKYRPADQGHAASDESQLPEGPQRGCGDRGEESRRPREGDRRWHGADLSQRI